MVFLTSLFTKSSELQQSKNWRSPQDHTARRAEQVRGRGGGQCEAWRKAEGIRIGAESARTTQAGLRKGMGGTFPGEKARELEKGLLFQCDKLSNKQAPRDWASQRGCSGGR